MSEMASRSPPISAQIKNETEAATQLQNDQEGNQDQDQDQHQEESELEEEEEEEEEAIRLPDTSYFAQLISANGGTFSESDSVLLAQLQAADDDLMIDTILDSYFLKKEEEKREFKFQLALNDFQQEQALQKIALEMEKNKIEECQSKEKKSREQQLQAVLTWLKRNIRFLHQEKDKEDYEKIRKELEGFVDRKHFISFECYEFLNEKTGGKYQSILDEITDFPADEDDNYVYDDA
jgi:hypothetical protein